MTEAVIGKLVLENDDSLPLRDVVYHTLRDAILEGTLPPGTRLMELQLSARLGVSRTPVREAMHLLSMDGLVNTSVRRGTVVAPIKAEDLRDAMEVRDALEELAARKACHNIKPEQLRQLKELEREFEDSLQKENAKFLARLDARFHEKITEIAGNARLTRQLGQIRQEIFRYRMESLKDTGIFPGVAAEHRQVIEAMQSGDEEKAAKAVRDHIRNSQQVLLEHISD